MNAFEQATMDRVSSVVERKLRSDIQGVLSVIDKVKGAVAEVGAEAVTPERKTAGTFTIVVLELLMLRGVIHDAIDEIRRYAPEAAEAAEGRE